MKRENRIRLYKIGCLLFAALLLLLPQRNVPYADLRVIATVLGVDDEGGRVTVSAQLAVPVASGSGGKASDVASASGDSLGEALEKMEIGIGRRIEYGHLSTVALGKEMGYKAAKSALSYLLASGKAGASAFLVFCPSTPASEFIEQAQELGDSSDAELRRYITYFKSENHVSTVNVLQFLQSLNAPSHTIFVPCVRLESDSSEENAQSGGEGGDQGGGQGGGESGGQDAQSGDQSSGQGGGESGKRKKMVAADTVAVFGGGKDAPVILDERTTRGIVWQDGDSRFGLVELKNVLIDGQTEASVTARLTSKQVHAKLTHEGGNACAYKIKVKLKLESMQVLGEQMVQARRKKALEREFERMIENSVQEAAAVSKERGLDFLELRTRFYHFCMKGFKTFDLSKTEVKVKAKVKIVV